MYLQVIWKEPRLIAPDKITQSGAMDQKFLNMLWIPDIQIYSLKDFNKIGLIHDTLKAGGLSIGKLDALIIVEFHWMINQDKLLIFLS